MGCFELFLLAQKVKGDDHIFLGLFCCSDVQVNMCMHFIVVANPFLRINCLLLKTILVEEVKASSALGNCVVSPVEIFSSRGS